MHIQTVIFDAGNTLLTPALPEAQVFHDAALSLGVQVDVDLIENHIPAMYRYYEELFARDNSLWADDERAAGIWLDMYQYLCDLLGISQIGPQVSQLAFDTYLNPRSWKVFDDVLPTLEGLQSQDINLGLISNWDSSLESILAGTGITPFFKAIISSAVVGLHKPQPEIFDLGIEELGASKDTTLYVGDHLDADIIGAARSGLTPVLIDRHNKHEGLTGYLRIRDLRDLLGLLS